MAIVILLNSVSLSLYDYSDRDSETRFNQILDLVNVIFTAIFIIESALKIVAKGFVLH